MKASYIWAGVAIIAIGVIGYLLVVREAGAVIVIKQGDREVSLKFDDNRIPYESLFQRIFDQDRDSFAQTAILANLEKKEIYHRESLGLIAMLKKEHPDSKLSKEIRFILNSMVGPFDRRVHTYHDITSATIVAVTPCGAATTIATRRTPVESASSHVRTS